VKRRVNRVGDILLQHSFVKDAWGEGGRGIRESWGERRREFKKKVVERKLKERAWGGGCSVLRPLGEGSQPFQLSQRIRELWRGLGRGTKQGGFSA